MRFIWLTLLFVCVGCVSTANTHTQYPITTEEPAATVEEALEEADPLLDTTDIVELPYERPSAVVEGAPAPFSGTLFSEFDTARYSILDPSAEEWRTRAVTTEWRLARTERRDAEVEQRQDERIATLARATRRLRRTTGIVVVLTAIGATLLGYEVGH